MKLNLRPAEECTFDAVSLGEVMLRLDPGEGRIRTARSFRAWEGGGEYNVIRGLHKCFGMNTAVITAFADNEVGLLMKDFIEQGGVSIDGEKITDVKYTVAKDALTGEGVVLKKGKKKFNKVFVK